jgi:hypothetical protein
MPIRIAPSFFGVLAATKPAGVAAAEEIAVPEAPVVAPLFVRLPPLSDVVLFIP